MKRSKKQDELLKIENQKKLDLATQWFLNLKKGMPVFIQDHELGREMVVFCEQEVSNGDLIIDNKCFKYKDGLLVNGVGRIWLNGSHGVYLFEATKQLIETTPIFLPKNTTPELMQAITFYLNEIFKS